MRAYSQGRVSPAISGKKGRSTVEVISIPDPYFIASSPGERLVNR